MKYVTIKSVGESLKITIKKGGIERSETLNLPSGTIIEIEGNIDCLIDTPPKDAQ